MDLPFILLIKDSNHQFTMFTSHQFTNLIQKELWALKQETVLSNQVMGTRLYTALLTLWIHLTIKELKYLEQLLVILLLILDLTKEETRLSLQLVILVV